MADEPTEPGDPPSSGRDGPHHSAQDVRGGEIVLRKHWQRLVFVAGLAGFVILALLINVLA